MLGTECRERGCQLTHGCPQARASLRGGCGWSNGRQEGLPWSCTNQGRGECGLAPLPTGSWKINWRPTSCLSDWQSWGAHTYNPSSPEPDAQAPRWVSSQPGLDRERFLLSGTEKRNQGWMSVARGRGGDMSCCLERDFNKGKGSRMREQFGVSCSPGEEHPRRRWEGCDG